ncbi:MAG: hypothetical protein KIT72_05440 [Polyangiaceae bacterium]|nr:hypothetical protein [Polyangiaceae bacterium]MCW5789842.1 hypothetical protein [Polyangiaceae bacterium]
MERSSRLERRFEAGATLRGAVGASAWLAWLGLSVLGCAGSQVGPPQSAAPEASGAQEEPRSAEAPSDGSSGEVDAARKQPPSAEEGCELDEDCASLLSQCTSGGTARCVRPWVEQADGAAAHALGQCSVTCASAP